MTTVWTVFCSILSRSKWIYGDVCYRKDVLGLRTHLRINADISQNYAKPKIPARFQSEPHVFYHLRFKIVSQWFCFLIKFTARWTYIMLWALGTQFASTCFIISTKKSGLYVHVAITNQYQTTFLILVFISWFCFHDWREFLKAMFFCATMLHRINTIHNKKCEFNNMQQSLLSLQDMIVGGKYRFVMERNILFWYKNLKLHWCQTSETTIWKEENHAFTYITSKKNYDFQHKTVFLFSFWWVRMA